MWHGGALVSRMWSSCISNDWVGTVFVWWLVTGFSWKETAFSSWRTQCWPGRFPASGKATCIKTNSGGCTRFWADETCGEITGLAGQLSSRCKWPESTIPHSGGGRTVPPYRAYFRTIKMRTIFMLLMIRVVTPTVMGIGSIFPEDLGRMRSKPNDLVLNHGSASPAFMLLDLQSRHSPSLTATPSHKKRKWNRVARGQPDATVHHVVTQDKLWKMGTQVGVLRSYEVIQKKARLQIFENGDSFGGGFKC